MAKGVPSDGANIANYAAAAPYNVTRIVGFII
jgi:hypothetical protein